MLYLVLFEYYNTSSIEYNNNKNNWYVKSYLNKIASTFVCKQRNQIFSIFYRSLIAIITHAKHVLF